MKKWTARLFMMTLATMMLHNQLVSLHPTSHAVMVVSQPPSQASASSHLRKEEQVVSRDGEEPIRPALTSASPVSEPSAPVLTVPIDYTSAPSTPPPPVSSAPPKPKPRPQVAVGEVQAFALAQLGQTQYACLFSIVHRENPGWITTRYNTGGSGAYGIPQALPGSKMASAGSDWRTNGVTQVKWMIRYVIERYGSACDAWTFRQQHSWY